MNLQRLTDVFRSKKVASQPIYEPIPIIDVVEKPPEYEAMLSSFKNQCIAIGLRRMLEPDRFFSICDVDQFAKTANIIIDRDIHNALKCLHCVHWRDMPVETRRMVYTILGEVFGNA